MSPFIVPSETVMLVRVRRNTSAKPAAANANSSIRYLLEHFRHLDVPRARLRPGWHAPQRMPEWLKAHCSSESFSCMDSCLGLQ